MVKATINIENLQFGLGLDKNYPNSIIAEIYKSIRKIKLFMQFIGLYYIVININYHNFIAILFFIFLVVILGDLAGDMAHYILDKYGYKLSYLEEIEYGIESFMW